LFELKGVVSVGIRPLLVVALDKQTARGEGRVAQILMSRVCCLKNFL